MKSSLLTLAIAMTLGFAGSAFAQAEPGVIEDPTAVATPVAEEAPDASTLLTEFINAKGWTEGHNAVNGKTFIVSIGTGVVAAPPSNSSYNDSRARAFTKAMLDAKAKMAEYLEVSIATAAGFAYAEHEVTATDDPQAQMAAALAAMPDESICGKIVTLIHKKLDKALAAEGYSSDKAKADYAAAKARLDSVVATSEFQQSIAASATTALSGLQAFYTVEALQNGVNGGEIGVVVVWSPALAEMANSMLSGKPVATKAAKTPILDQIPTDSKVLLSTFGVQQKIDENGQLVLVSFAQSSAKTTSKQSEKAAYDKARLLAQSMIRNFAGEVVATNNALNEAETTLEFADGSTPTYKDESAYSSFQQTFAAALEINGINVVKRWKATSPVNGQTVYGVVCSWSPSSAAFARAAKRTIEDAATLGAAGVRTEPTTTEISIITIETTTPVNYLHGGAESDDDAF